MPFRLCRHCRAHCGARPLPLAAARGGRTKWFSSTLCGSSRERVWCRELGRVGKRVVVGSGLPFRLCRHCRAHCGARPLPLAAARGGRTKWFSSTLCGSGGERLWCQTWGGLGKSGGREWIRTTEGNCQQIYSLPRLAASVPYHIEVLRRQRCYGVQREVIYTEKHPRQAALRQIPERS